MHAALAKLDRGEFTIYDNVLIIEFRSNQMDWEKGFADVITNVVTWIATVVIGPIIVASIPKLRTWFSQRPWAVAAGVAFLTSGLTAAAMWTVLRLSTSLEPHSIAVSRTSPDQARGPYGANDNNTPLGTVSEYKFCAISYYTLAVGTSGQCGVIKDGQFWKVVVSGGQYCRVICFK
jgi:hypothetical protein